MHTCTLRIRVHVQVLVLVLLSMPHISNGYIVNMIGRWAYSASPAEFGKQRPGSDVNRLNLFVSPDQNSGSFTLCTVPDITFTNTDADNNNDTNTNTNANATRFYEDRDRDYDNSKKKGKVEEHGDGDDSGISTRRMLREETALFETKKEEDSYKKNIAILIERGGCSIHQKALNVLEWNAKLRAAANPNGVNSNVPSIELIIVANRNDYVDPSYPFDIVKEKEEVDVDLFILSMGNRHASHLYREMWEYALKTAGSGGKMELELSAFLPLDSPDRSVERDWVFPILDTDYVQRQMKFKNIEILLIFVCMSLTLPLVRMFFHCCALYSFGWRRNERGWINGITWTRRAQPMSDARWMNLIGNLPFMTATRRTTLTEKEVLSLPIIRYDEEDVNDLIEKYQTIFESDDLSEADAADNQNGNGDGDDLVDSNADSITNNEDGDAEAGDNSTRSVHMVENKITNKEEEEKSSEEVVENKSDEGLNTISPKNSNSFKAAYTSCTMCSICICEFEEGEELRLLPACGHIFHTECILPWLTEKKNACPLCQKKVKVISNADDTEDEGENDGENVNVIRPEEGSITVESPLEDSQGDTRLDRNSPRLFIDSARRNQS